MSDKERFISGVRTQNERLRELLDSLEKGPAPGSSEELGYYDEVLRRVETDLRRLRLDGRQTGKYELRSIYPSPIRF